MACLKRAAEGTKNRAVLRKCLGISQVLHVVCPFDVDAGLWWRICSQ